MKMKWLKREFAALTAAVLTVVSLGGIPVSAATVAPHTRNYDFNTAAIANPASVTESELKAIFGEEWKGVSLQKPLLVDQGTSVDPKNTYRYAIVDKAFGKEPGDKAFRMWIDGILHAAFYLGCGYGRHFKRIYGAGRHYRSGVCQADRKRDFDALQSLLFRPLVCRL